MALILSPILLPTIPPLTYRKKTIFSHSYILNILLKIYSFSLSESTVNIDLGDINFTPSTKNLVDAEKRHTMLDRVWTSQRTKVDDTSFSKNHSRRRKSTGSGAAHEQRPKKEKSVKVILKQVFMQVKSEWTFSL